MKKKKKKLVRYQGTKSSIVNRMRDAATTILSNVPKPKIQGTTKTTNIDFPTPKADTRWNSISTSKPKPVYDRVRTPDYNPNVKNNTNIKKYGGQKWTRNTANGSRRSK